jgi:plastocyanin
MHFSSPYRLVLTAAFAAFALFAVACGPADEAPPPPAEEGAEAPAAAPARQPGEGKAAIAALQQGDATITGTISYTGQVPTLQPLALDADPDCAAKHSEPVYPQTLVLGDGNTLGNIFVQVKDTFAQGDYPPPAAPVVVDQQGCMYEPHVVGVLAGQPLEFWNSDGILHNVHLTPKLNREQNLGMPGSLKQKAVTLNTPELYVPVKCDVHPWMSAYVAVMSHPYFAVTAEDGHYEIRVPAGTYTLEGWHERLGTRTAPVTVAAGETATVDLAFDVPAQ